MVAYFKEKQVRRLLFSAPELATRRAVPEKRRCEKGGKREIVIEARRTVSSLSSVAGLRLLNIFPFGRIVQVAQAKRRSAREDIRERSGRLTVAG